MVYQYRKDTGCINSDRLSKATFRCMISDMPAAAFFENLTDDQWDILSFDALSRNVCVRIYAPSETIVPVNGTYRTVNTLSLKLPVLSNSSSRT